MKPLVKILGGKRALAPQIVPLLPRFTAYREPFAGGAAILCALWNAGALAHCTSITLGDASAPIMWMYWSVKEEPGKLIAELEALEKRYYAEDPSALYYEQRKLWNEGHRATSRFMFLKQTAVNGLWRENKSGGMNASWGMYQKPAIVDHTNILEWHQALKRISLLPGTYAGHHPGRDELVLIDPPYAGTFNAYTAEGWSPYDDVQLLTTMWKWAQGGARLAFCNEQSHEILQLIAMTFPYPSSTTHIMKCRRSVNSDGEGRGPVPEILVVV